MVLVAACAESPKHDRPNILFIMTDDHAAHAISAYGSRVNSTPHLDRLASEGIRLDRCFATNSICTPSRATILTGKYSHKNGVTVFNEFDGSQPHVSRMLQRAGYYTGVVGKWHLTSEPTGFDRWTVLPGQGIYQDPVFLTPKGRVTKPGYVTDVITDMAIDFLDTRPKDQPFFLMCHHKAPHRPWEPDEKHRALFAGRQIPEPPTLRDNYDTRGDALRENKQRVFDDLTRRDLKIAAPLGLSAKSRNAWLDTVPTEATVISEGQSITLRGAELQSWKYQRYMQDYLACVQSVDDNIGRLMGELQARGLAENTLVVYTSDQGFFLGDHGLYDKRFMYDPSIKMPFIARWPQHIKPRTTSGSLAINADFAPTFLEAAGIEVPSDVQGTSLRPLFTGAVPSSWRQSFYYRYYHDPGDHNTRAHYGVRTETHKLIYFPTKDQWELFDLVRDPDELRNLVSDPASESLLATLKAELARLRRDLDDR